MNKKLAGALATTLLVAGVVGVTAAPANAGTREDNCPSGATCTWGDRYYLTSGKASARIYFYQYVSNYSGLGYPGTSVSGNDTATSIFNNGRAEISYLYKNAGRNSLVLTLARGAGYDQLNAQAPVANDVISSGYYASFN